MNKLTEDLRSRREGLPGIGKKGGKGQRLRNLNHCLQQKRYGGKLQEVITGLRRGKGEISRQPSSESQERQSISVVKGFLLAPECKAETTGGGEKKESSLSGGKKRSSP